MISPVPVTCVAQAIDTMRAVEGCAAAAIFRAAGVVGVSTGASGAGSSPMNTDGRPELSSTLAISPTTSVGGGRNRSMTRSEKDCDAACPSVGTGPTASSPPASQMMRIACAAPRRPPTTRSAPDSTPRASRSASARPIAEPTASPTITAPMIAPSTTSARGMGSRPKRLADQPGREVERDEQAPDGAGDAADLRQGAGPRARHDGGEDDERRDQVEQVHRASMGEVRRRCRGAGEAGATGGRCATRPGDPGLTRRRPVSRRRSRDTGAASPTAVMVYVPGSSAPRSTTVALYSAISGQAMPSCWAPSRTVRVMAVPLRATSTPARAWQGAAPLHQATVAVTLRPLAVAVRSAARTSRTWRRPATGVTIVGEGAGIGPPPPGGGHGMGEQCSG